ncbi:hypothetical protein HNQ71_000284 [Mesorhizobium sangaii]|uniref:Uncharacterized protein n=1 Tax=Mesorhizobium sangaii TaxID=505389 RepID=A0A841P9M1_9HYPH|nr:hypothetical protein [Mesorhizobium sangaii]
MLTPSPAVDRDIAPTLIGPRLRHETRAFSGEEMTDKPETTYIVSVFEKPHWRTVLTTRARKRRSRSLRRLATGACGLKRSRSSEFYQYPSGDLRKQPFAERE